MQLAIEALYTQHATALFAYLRSHTPTREDAEDLLIEVFLAALEQELFHELAGEHQVAWLWRVTRNKTADLYRRQKRRPQAPLESILTTHLEEECQGPVMLAERAEEYRRLIATLAKLSTEQQRMLSYRYVHGLRSPEIARVTGKREGTIRMILSRTLALLRTIYIRDDRGEAHAG